MRLTTLAAGVLSLGLAAATGCSSSDSPSTSGTGGTTGTGGGSAGGTGGSSAGGAGGGSGGSSAGGSSGDAGGGTFMAVAPCASASDYTEGSAITFAVVSYTPKCLKVKAGTEVKFSGMFAGHPLSPSKKRGDTTNNPIKETSSGTEATFKFEKAGYYGFYCMFHGFSDDGMNMAGVVWVTP